jgi:hypothetical protein
MRSNQRRQLFDKGIVHIAIGICNMETDDPFSGKLLAELGAKSIAMALFHHENDISPAKMPWRYTNTRAWLCARRAHLMSIDTIKDPFSRETALAILATNEQKFHALSFSRYRGG